MAPAPAPLFHDIAEGPEGGAAAWLEASDGVRIRVAVWPAAGAAEARGTVFLLPGRTEYIEKYGRVARNLTAAGHKVLAIDWRGQGLSDRLLPDTRAGHVGKFSDYQRDLAAAARFASARALPRPWHMLAHSMGGCIGLRALMECAGFASVAFSGPMWGIAMPPRDRAGAWALGLLAPLVGQGHRYAPTTGPEPFLLTAPFEDNPLTTDRDSWDFMRRQIERHPELALGGPTLRWLGQALLECLRLSWRAAPQVACLTLVGANERVVDPRRIRARMARWPGGRHLVLPDAEHEVLMERPETRERAMSEILAHFAAAGRAQG